MNITENGFESAVLHQRLRPLHAGLWSPTAAPEAPRWHASCLGQTCSTAHSSRDRESSVRMIRFAKVWWSGPYYSLHPQVSSLSCFPLMASCWAPPPAWTDGLTFTALLLMVCPAGIIFPRSLSFTVGTSERRSPLGHLRRNAGSVTDMELYITAPSLDLSSHRLLNMTANMASNSGWR